MEVQSKINRIAKFSALALAWAGKSAIVLALFAVLGFTQNLYGIDVRLSSRTPLIQIQIILPDSMPRLSWHRFAKFAGSLFHTSVPPSSPSHDQVCSQSQKQHLG